MPWLPAHQAHAIERVSVTFQFAEPVPSKAWQALLNRASVDLPLQGFNVSLDEMEFNFPQASNFPGVPQMNAFVFGPDGLVPQGQPQTGVGGKTFRRVSGDSVQEEISLLRTRFIYATTLYDRWAGCKKRIANVLGLYLSAVLSSVDISLIKLEYWDRFVSEESGSNAVFAQLFRQDSKHVPEFIFDMHELWHTHVGYFLHTHDVAKRLINVNLDAIDLEERDATNPSIRLQRRSVGIYTMVQDTVRQDAPPSDIDATMVALDGMHAILKDVLADVISEEAARLISLDAKAQS
ncbi:TIGR04255 family protein [Xanthobacter flavus]|uniref:TIGR04255 family protein n=1 Tax=Xanthobacter flavus TaxID=281 RepID=UPI00372A2ACA